VFLVISVYIDSGHKYIAFFAHFQQNWSDATSQSDEMHEIGGQVRVGHMQLNPVIL